MRTPHLDAVLGRDALRVWLDFWELTGSLRVDILRQDLRPVGGDPAKMIPPEVTITTIPSVRAVLIDRDIDTFPDRAGAFPVRKAKLELVDAVRASDRLAFGGVIYRIDSIANKDLGCFSVWIVEATRIE
jgi:hypothetical protein